MTIAGSAPMRDGRPLSCRMDSTAWGRIAGTRHNGMIFVVYLDARARRVSFRHSRLEHSGDFMPIDMSHLIECEDYGVSLSLWIPHP